MPVGQHNSVRILIRGEAVKQRPLRQIDVSNAFLCAIVDTIIFLEQPLTFEEDEAAICLLHKSLYGIESTALVAAVPLQCSDRARISALPHDQGMYLLDSCGHFILQVAYVDDLLYTGDDSDLLDRLERDIKEKLEVMVNHNVTHFRGLNIMQSADSIPLSAAKYAKTLANKFCITPVNLITPFRVPPPNYAPDTTPLSTADHRLFQQQFGCLLFAAVICRPDLSYAASQLAQ
ncbi:unnamed protein product [Closterium sp. NIES-53]